MDKRQEKKKKQLRYKINTFLARYFTWLLLAMATIILAGGYFFLLAPKYKKITEEIKSAGEERKKEYADSQEYLKKVKELKSIYRQINPADIKKIDILLPDKEEREKLMAEMEAIALKNGLLLASLQVQTQKQETGTKNAAAASAKAVAKGEKGVPEGVNTVKISMEIIGTDYVGLKNILSALENNLRLIDVTKLSFMPQENKTFLEAVAYYRKK